jgi:vanillate O-demethylase monooxygenase subunit
LEQDRVVVESQRPEELPIDLSEELHIKGVDQASIEYRRWLLELTSH